MFLPVMNDFIGKFKPMEQIKFGNISMAEFAQDSAQQDFIDDIRGNFYKIQRGALHSL